MNIREYIESGILELYVMNVLSAQEAAEVEALARQYPDIQAEIDSIQNTMQSYAQAHAIAPREGLKEEILQKIQSETPKNNAENEKITAPKSPLSISSILSWSLVAILGIASVVLYTNYQKLKADKEKCEQDQNLQQLKNQKAIADMESKLNILKNPDTKIIPLNGLPIAPTAKATIYWNNKEKATYLTIQNLPQPDKDKQYQLWAIVDKKPVDAGVFAYNVGELQIMKGFEKAEAFAVTLEPQGGSVSPTVEKMYVLGTL